MQLHNTISKMAERFDWQSCQDYGEPGYHKHEGREFIILGNFNELERHPERQYHQNRYARLHGYKRIMAQIEEQAEIEWSDEWVVDMDGVKCYRTTDDCYQWEPSTAWNHEGDLLTPDDDIEMWIDFAIDNSSVALTSRMVGGELDAKLEAAGWVRYPDDDTRFESGWYPGQTDDPKVVYARIKQEHGEEIGVLFTILEISQFYMNWAAWYKPEPVREALGNNHWSDDMNLQAVVASMGDGPWFDAFNAAFPEFNNLVLDGASFDVEAAGLDMEYTSWCIDWIENNTPVYWDEGEPWVREDANWPIDY